MESCIATEQNNLITRTTIATPIFYPAGIEISDFFNSQYNNRNTSDLTVLIVDTKDGKTIKKTFYLHRLVLCQASYFHQMLYGQTNEWGESKSRSIEIAVYEENWIREDILDVFFQMFYQIDFSHDPFQKKIRYMCLELYHLSRRFGFERAKNHCETLISEGITYTNMMDITRYCVLNNAYEDRVYKTVFQWLKLWFFTVSFHTLENVSFFDMALLKELIFAEDTIVQYKGNELVMLSFYEESHQILSEKDHQELLLLKSHIKEKENLIKNHPRSRTIGIIHILDLDWPSTKTISLHRSIIGKFENLCSCDWTISLIHDHKNEKTWISICSSYLHPKKSMKRITCIVNIVVHVVCRTKTYTTKHIGTVRSDAQNLKLIDSVPNEALNDRFIIENEGDCESHKSVNAIGFIIQITISQIKKMRGLG